MSRLWHIRIGTSNSSLSTSGTETLILSLRMNRMVRRIRIVSLRMSRTDFRITGIRGVTDTIARSSLGRILMPRLRLNRMVRRTLIVRWMTQMDNRITGIRSLMSLKMIRRDTGLVQVGMSSRNTRLGLVLKMIRMDTGLSGLSSRNTRCSWWRKQ